MPQRRFVFTTYCRLGCSLALLFQYNGSHTGASMNLYCKAVRFRACQEARESFGGVLAEATREATR
jgi:hypothetical protein